MTQRAFKVEPEEQRRLEALRDQLDQLAEEVRIRGLEIAARLLDAASRDVSERIRMEPPRAEN